MPEQFLHHIDVGPEPLERIFSDFLDVLWPAISPGRSPLRLGIDFPAEFRGDHDSLAKRCEGFTHEFFVYVWTIDLGRVEERDAAFDGRYGSPRSSPVCLWAGYKEKLIPMQPSPIAET
jgi:hypothetical protein